MQVETYFIEAGNYVRIVVEGRQRPVPCKVVGKAGLLLRCKPLAKCSVDVYEVPVDCVVSIVNPKEVEHGC